MKKHTLLYICSLLIVAASSMMPVYAQQPKGQYALYNYRNDGDFNAWLNIDIDSITYSRIDTLGVEHDDVVVQEVWTPDSLYRIPLEAIDSIGFRAPEPEYQDNVFHITPQHLPYIIEVGDYFITFSSSLPINMRPQVGQVITSDTFDEPLSNGFAGKVKDIKEGENTFMVICDIVNVTDVFKKLVIVGKAYAIDGETANQRHQNAHKRLSEYIDSDHVEFEFPGKFSAKINDFISFSDEVSMSADYYVYVDIPRFKVRATVTGTHDLKTNWTIDSDKILEWLGYDIEKSEPEWATPVWPIVNIPGVFNFGVRAGAFLAPSVKLSLTGSTPLTFTHTFGVEFSNTENWSWIPTVTPIMTAHSELGTPDITLSLEGKLFAGVALGLKTTLIGDNVLSGDITGRFGPEFDAKIQMQQKFGDEDKVNWYSLLKDSKVGVELKADVKVKAMVFGENMTSKLSWDWKWSIPGWEDVRYLFPDFTKPELPHWSMPSPLSMYTTPSRDIIMPVQVGIGLFDDKGMKLPNYYNYNEDWYLLDVDWHDKDTQINIENLPAGSTYTCRPLIKFLGMGEIAAEPRTTFTIPYPVSLPQSSLNINKGDTRTIRIENGWGDFEVKNNNHEVVAATIIKHQLADGTPISDVHIEGKKDGNAIIKVVDLRSKKETELKVEVTDGTVTPTTISISHTAIDFGTMTEGKTAKRRFKVTNDGESTITIQASCESDYFKLSDNKAKFTLAKGESKDYTVTCNGLPTSGDVNAVIIITSDGDAESQRITLSAKGEESDVPADAPSIPVETETIVVKGVPFTMIGVEGGSYMMGSSDDDLDASMDEKPQHLVKLSDFAIGQTEVTQALWRAVMGDNPSYHKGNDNYPVEQVTRDMCQTFISKLNALTGRTFRLPTEAEWEYAARGGNNSQGHKYAGSNDVDEVSWYDRNSDGVTHPVAQKKANELGLYDMSGNVWELCQDYFDKDYYSISPIVNPCNTTESYAFTMRSGGPYNDSYFNRVAYRADQVLLDNQQPVDSNWDIGLRLVLSDGKTGYNETPVEDEVEAYAVYEDGVLTFYYDNQKVARGGMSVGPFEYKDSREWNDAVGTITSVVFDTSFANCSTLTSTSYWFWGCENLTSITGIDYLNTSNVTNMVGMFHCCSNLTSLDVTKFDTHNVTDMGAVFRHCSKLTTLDLSNFNTSNVKDMIYMFCGCSSLTSLDLSHFDTSNVTTMESMFCGCSGLTTINLSTFDTSNVKRMNRMFEDCSSLASLDLSHFDTSNVTAMWDMFYGCSNLASLDLSHFDTSNVTGMTAMFRDCYNLTNLDLSNFNTSNVELMIQMFCGCSSLASLDLSHFNTRNVKDMFRIFSGCEKLGTIYCSNLWDTNKVKHSDGMFSGCYKLLGGKGTKYDSNHTDAEYAHIDGGVNNPGYFTDINSTQESSPMISVTPANIDFGMVEYGKIKKETFTVTNNGKSTFTIHVPQVEDSELYFEVSDTDKEFILTPGQSKEYTVTWHGLEKGCWAEVDFRVCPNADNEAIIVHVQSVGWDDSPLLAENTLTLNVGDSECVMMQGSYHCTYEISNNSPNVVKAEKGGDTSWNGSIGFDGNHGGGYTYLCIEALSSGIAIVKVIDSVTKEEGTITITVNPSDIVHVPVEAIDLGLPSGTLWASCNVGASKPEEYGGYYAWGETEEKDDYSWNNYSYLEIYEQHDNYTTVICKDIGNHISGTQYDVAHMKWGGDWRMPTKSEMDELLEYCVTEVTIFHDVQVMKFTGPSGKSIFFPFPGAYFYDDGEFINEGFFTMCWSGDLDFNATPWALAIYSDNTNWVGRYSSNTGFSIRPVASGGGWWIDGGNPSDGGYDGPGPDTDDQGDL